MIYLDYGATSWPKPEGVRQAVLEALEGGSADRTSGTLAAWGKARIEEVRAAAAAFLGASGPERIVFTYGATDGLNLCIKGVLRDGGHAVITALEHNAVIRPLTGLADRAAAEHVVVPFGQDGRVDPGRVAAEVKPGKTRLVVVNHVSNVLGTIQPVAAVAEAVREVDPQVLVLVDAAQSAGHFDVSPESLEADLIAFTGHKGLHGPPGTGLLYVGPRAEKRVPPWREGGTGDGDVRHPVDLPKRLEAGTPNLPGISGLGAGIAWVSSKGGPDALLAHERRLARRLRRSLADLPGLRFLGPEEPETGIVAFVPAVMKPMQAAELLAERHDIACRGGLSCAPLLHEQLGTRPGGALRLSVGPATTEEDVDRGAEAVRSVLGEA